MNKNPDVTAMLQRAEQGDPSAADHLLPVVYDELRRLAAEMLSYERPGQTLQATALVHEAWVRLVDVDQVQRWSGRRHFLGAAAEVMRRILVDKARRRNRQKHGADWRRITIQPDGVLAEEEDRLLESLDAALRRFQAVDATACELVKLRYFVGVTLAEAAETLDLSRRNADRIWAYAKAWLLREIQRETVDLP